MKTNTYYLEVTIHVNIKKKKNRKTTHHIQCMCSFMLLPYEIMAIIKGNYDLKRHLPYEKARHLTRNRRKLIFYTGLFG